MKWYELVRVWQGRCIRCTGSNPVLSISKLDLWSNWITGNEPKAKPRRGTFRQRLQQPLCQKCKDLIEGEEKLLRRYQYAIAIGMPHVEAAVFAADASGYSERCYGVIAVVTSHDDRYVYYDLEGDKKFHATHETGRSFRTALEAKTHAMKNGYEKVVYDASARAY